MLPFNFNIALKVKFLNSLYASTLSPGLPVLQGRTMSPSPSARTPARLSTSGSELSWTPPAGLVGELSQCRTASPVCCRRCRRSEVLERPLPGHGLGPRLSHPHEGHRQLRQDRLLHSSLPLRRPHHLLLQRSHSEGSVSRSYPHVLS